jgi:glyoxylase-like metal-dependent hydrolase (beta-lactamase superfamily II)
VLACGDYLSPVEIPMLSAGGGLDAYMATLERLRPLAEQAVAVVPGHGAAMDAAGALRLLEEDRSYLDALAREGASAPLPPGRVTDAQRHIHIENASRVTSSWS